MKKYIRYFYICLFAFFSFYYTNKVIELSHYNDNIMVSINEFASKNDYDCKEGSINNDGIILGLSGLIVDKNKSYNNMKGIGFKKELIEYKEKECILNKKNNIDKYIISGNKEKNNISLIVDVDTSKYYLNMLNIAEDKNVTLNFLMNSNTIVKEINNITNHNNILFKGSSNKELNEFIDVLHNEIYCVKNNEFDVINICKDKNINSIKIINYIKKDLITNIKSYLNNGAIIFIEENNNNLKELSAAINYINSRGYNIVAIDDLLL